MAKINKNTNPDSWVDLYGDSMYRYAIARVMRQEIAEDLVQETFLAALKGIDRFKGESSEKTWIFAILKNKIIDHFRKIKSRKEDEFNFTMPFKEDGLMYKHWQKGRGPQNWISSSKDLLESSDFQRIFKFCLSLLSPRLATAFSLKIVEEIDSDDICKEMEISSSNFWVMMHRARLQLRECMESKWLKH